ncbi:MAG TPA: PqqD family protein [Terriglobales bacterium]|nr:PqqD family protein [Terriglobales bacterium]
MVSRVIADETLIVPIRRGVGDLSSIYSLNPVASAIWNAIAQPRTQAEILEAIRQEFEEMPQSACSDIEAFLAEMASAGLVSVAETGVAA